MYENALKINFVPFPVLCRFPSEGTAAQCNLHDQKMTRASRRLEVTLSRWRGR